MANKKKLVRVEPLVSQSMYKSTRIKFALVAKSKTTRRQVAKFCTCRDYINDILRARTHEKSYFGFYTHDPSGEFVVDMTRLRLLIGKDNLNVEEEKSFRQRIFSAKRLINLYEKSAGWNKNSVITTVKFKEEENKGTKTRAWLLTGPGKWLAYSQLVSMLTLIFRIASNYGPIEFDNNDDVEKWFLKLLLRYQENVESGIFEHDSDIGIYLPVCWDKFQMIAVHYKDIFTQPLEEAYPATGDVHDAGGIYHLCLFDTYNKTLDGNMKKVYNEYSKTVKKHKKKLMKEAKKEFEEELEKET